MIHDIQPTLFGSSRRITAKKYPDAPGWKRQDTSKAAAEAIAPKAEKLRERVYQLLLTGDYSADLAAEELGLDKLSVRPRFSELSKLGRIFDTGIRTLNRSGKSAAVWRAVR